MSLGNSKRLPSIQEPGLYTLLAVRTKFCDGEVLEPSTFMLTNPPEPDLSIVHDEIKDNCGKKVIGYRVGLELVGTPPFKVQYTVHQKGRKSSQVHTKEVDGVRGQMEFKPSEAGHYTYRFTEVSDAVYKGISFGPQREDLELSHDIRPAASAAFIDPSARKRACIDEPVSFDVHLQGEGPWGLDYEIVHNGRRTRLSDSNIEDNRHTITTPKLSNGGEYSIVLTGIKDVNGCKEALQQNAQVQVRHQRPKVAFGSVEGKRSLRTLEGKYVDIPLRLSGEGPWTVEYSFNDLSLIHI